MSGARKNRPGTAARSRKGNPDRLLVYRSKRNFKTSPEPAGDKPARPRTQRATPTPQKPSTLQFCVQKHLASHLHYDFRLEHDGVLISWAIPKGPSLNPRDKRLAVQVEDHPLDYGQFEGVIPQGYGAGIVMLWDNGTWAPEVPDVAEALDKGELKFSLDGMKLHGSWVLVRTGKGRRSWLLIKLQDRFAGDIDVTASSPLSVKSFGDFPDILAAEEPVIWQSRLPNRSTAIGALLRDMMAQTGHAGGGGGGGAETGVGPSRPTRRAATPHKGQSGR